MTQAENPTDPAEAPPEDKKPGEGTEEPEERSQPGEESPPEPDPVDVAIEAAITANQERIKAEVTEQLKTEFEERRTADREAQTREDARTKAAGAFKETVKEIHSNLQSIKFFNAEGEESTLSDDAIEKAVVQSLNNYNSSSAEIAESRVLTVFSEAARKLLPPESWAEFADRAEGKDPSEWLDVLTELRAPKTQHAKRSKVEKDAAVAAAEARGERKGRESQSAPPKQGEDRGSGPTVDRESLTGMAAARNKGLISDADLLEFYNKRNQ